MKIKIKILCVCFCLIGGMVYADPPEGSKWKLIPELSDEFEGNKLDPQKWFDHNPGWRGRIPGFFSKVNVEVRDGKLHLTSRVEDLPNLPEEYHTFTTAAVKSKVAAKYGYFEVMCKMMPSRASSAFWFYNIEPDDWSEIDVFEAGPKTPGNENTIWFTLHYPYLNLFNRARVNYKNPRYDMYKGTVYKAPYAMTKEYHVYALEWDKDSIKFYVDDELQWSTFNSHWHQVLFMNFDSEIFTGWFGIPDKKNLPATYSIEYVRSWQKIVAPDIDRDQNGEAYINYDYSDADIYYTTDNSEPSKESKKYTKPFSFREKGVIKAVAYHKDGLKSELGVAVMNSFDPSEVKKSDELKELEKVIRIWEYEKQKSQSRYKYWLHNTRFGCQEVLMHNVVNDSIGGRQYFKRTHSNKEIMNEDPDNQGSLNMRFPLKIVDDYLEDAKKILMDHPAGFHQKIGLYFKNGSKGGQFFQIPGYTLPDSHDYIVVEFRKTRKP